MGQGLWKSIFYNELRMTSSNSGGLCFDAWWWLLGECGRECLWRVMFMRVELVCNENVLIIRTKCLSLQGAKTCAEACACAHSVAKTHMAWQRAAQIRTPKNVAKDILCDIAYFEQRRYDIPFLTNLQLRFPRE
jgi:hypothetical protein